MKAKKYTRCDLAMMGISTYGLAISVWASFGDIPQPLQGTMCLLSHSQEELLQELNREGFELTQATLSRDLKQLKVAKAASMNGKYVYVLPNNIMYKRSTDQSAGEMLRNNGFISLQFSGNIAVIRTRPGYASSMAYDIDNNEFSEILGTIAGDDTIMLVLREGVATSKVRQLLSLIIPNIE